MVLGLLSEGGKFNLENPVQTEAPRGRVPSHPQHQTAGTDGASHCSVLMGCFGSLAINLR